MAFCRLSTRRAALRKAPVDNEGVDVLDVALLEPATRERHYTIYSGTSHRTSADVRHDCRVVIAYKDEASSRHGSEVEKLVCTDQAAFKREDQKRWDLTLAHWDAPIRVLVLERPHIRECD